MQQRLIQATKTQTARKFAIDDDDAALPSNPLRRMWSRALGTRRKLGTVVLVALSLWVSYYAVFGHDGLVAYQQKRHQAEQLQQQIMATKAENQRMAQHAQRLKTDSDTIEYQAREQMHYARPGEVIYTLPQDPAAAKSK